MSFVDSWRSAQGIFRVFSWVDFAQLAGSITVQYKEKWRRESSFLTLICHCQSLIWATSWEHLPDLAVKMVDDFTLFSSKNEKKSISIFVTLKTLLPRGICVKAIGMLLYLGMTVLLRFFKLMQNALGAVLSLMCTFLIKVSADVSQSHSITFYNLQER